MIKQNTVFVLGAGASWHYGYPTGEQLVTSVIDMAKRMERHCDLRLEDKHVRRFIPTFSRTADLDREYQEAGIVPSYDQARAYWAQFRDQCQQLIARLRTVRPLVIDFFLSWNADLQPIGKLMIAAVILECEAIWEQKGGNENRRRVFANRIPRPTHIEIQNLDVTQFDDDWHRFVVHKLAYGCKKPSDLLSNRVHFVTFNYDASLEFHLQRSLAALQVLRGDGSIAEFLSGGRIVHMYGSVRTGLPPYTFRFDVHAFANLTRNLSQSPPQMIEAATSLIDHCWSAAQGLRTIDDHDKDGDGTASKAAKHHILNADVIYILGFGFDELNSARIGLPDAVHITRLQDRKVMFTNYGDINTVNKKMSLLVRNEPSAFTERSILKPSSIESGWLVEKSARDVYQAFANDFDSVETR